MSKRQNLQPNQKHPRPKSKISRVVKEATVGGIIYRIRDGRIQLLLVQDSKQRWTIPKGHIEPGEKPPETARREIHEETGLSNIDIQDWLGKVPFQYRRQNTLVLMNMQLYLVEALGNSDDTKKEDWMLGISWLPIDEALDKIEYEATSKLMLLAINKIKQRKGI